MNKRGYPIKRVTNFGAELAIQDFSVIVNYNTSSLTGRMTARVETMRERFSPYINEIVSLLVMLLMAFALLAGRAADGPEAAPAAEAAGDRAAPVNAATSRRW